MLENTYNYVKCELTIGLLHIFLLYKKNEQTINCGKSQRQGTLLN